MIVDKVEHFRELVDKVYKSPEYKERRKDMKRFMKYYTGRFWTEQEDDSDVETPVFCNFIFSTIQTIAPLLTDSRPIWYLRARKAFMQRYFEIYSSGLEYLWDKLEMDMKLFKWVLDALIVKMGIVKIYWRNDEVALDVVDPQTFVCAPGYDDIWEAPWCGTVTRKPLSWIRQRYPKTGKKVTAENDSLVDDTFDIDDKSEVELEGVFVSVYEIWVQDDTALAAIKENVEDRNEQPQKPKKKYPNGRIITFAQKITLEDRKSPFNHGKPPYVTLLNYITPHKLWGMGEPDQIESLVLEYNLALRKIAQYVRDYVDPDWVVFQGSGINPENFKSEKKGGGNVWDLNNNAEPPRVLEMPQINRTILDFLAGLPKLLEEISGNTAVTKGMAEKKQRQTAGEIATLVESSYTRTRQRVRNLENSTKRALYLIVDIMQQFYKTTRSYTLVRDGEVQAGEIGNSAELAKQVMEPTQKSGLFSGREVTEQRKQQEQDYKALVEYLGDAEEVYVDFDLEIQTNSTLPMDRQSLANLMLRLLEMGAVDGQAVLETLRVPKTEEITERLKEQQQPEAPAAQPTQEAMNV